MIKYLFLINPYGNIDFFQVPIDRQLRFKRRNKHLPVAIYVSTYKMNTFVTWYRSHTGRQITTDQERTYEPSQV